MYPLKFNPVYHERIWGGENLATKFNRSLPSKQIGESWDISAHPNGLSTVKNGPLAGKTIPELIREFGREFLGYNSPKSVFDRFPLLVKLLDANDQLSIQVHPDDHYALLHEGEPGKFEIWYILSATSDAKIVYGLKPGTQKKDFIKAIEENRVKDYLNVVPVEAGQVYAISPGLVHALGAGIIVAEIQQNSDTIYRVYDYDRIGPNGQPRPLHIEKALDVINFADFAPVPVPLNQNSHLIESNFFNVDLITIQGEERYYNTGASFYILTNLGGAGLICFGNEELVWEKGESVLLPAGVAEFNIIGDLKYLKTYLP